MTPFKRLLFLFLLLSISFSPSPHAETVFYKKADIIRQIENRHRGWLVLDAKATINFITPDNRKASCDANIKYEPMSEKVLLQCFNRKKELLFAFKTRDDHFEYFSPKDKVLFYGNIFDLENSDEMQSHIKPLHLYQSLKLAAIPYDLAEVESWNRDSVVMKIFSNQQLRSYTTRRLHANYQGEVFKEYYYRPDGGKLFIIERSSYKKINPREKKSILSFPHHIVVHDYDQINRSDDERYSSTELTFSRVEFVYSLGPKEWVINLPKGIQRLNITRDPWQAIKKPQAYQI